jgi:hypothetical protein
LTRRLIAFERLVVLALFLVEVGPRLRNSQNAARSAGRRHS